MLLNDACAPHLQSLAMNLDFRIDNSARVTVLRQSH
jgi:hypothetical protein